MARKTATALPGMNTVGSALPSFPKKRARKMKGFKGFAGKKKMPIAPEG